MIQDIAPYVYHNEYRPQKPERTSYVLHYEQGKALIKQNGDQISYYTFQDLEKRNPDIYDKAIYLFAIDEKRFYLVNELVPGDATWIPKEQFRIGKPLHLAFAGITGFQLFQWYRSHRFCGRCGKPMKHDKKERMMYCEACHLMEYPKICPAVIVGITYGNQLLLTKYADRDFKKYALVAGFAEIGESIEDTVRREVMEEVGLQVKNIQFYKSQPWSFSDTLLFGFYAEVDGTPEVVLDREELALAEWFEREEIPVHEKTISLTNEMILHFKSGKNI